MDPRWPMSGDPPGLCGVRNDAGRGPARQAGFTLVELMVVVVIIGIMTAAMIPEMRGSFQDALLRSSSRELINVFDLTSSRAVSLNQTRCVLLDESTGRYVVEKQVIANGQENLVPADDVPEGEGQLDRRIAVEYHPAEESTSEAEGAGAAPAPGHAASDRSRIMFYPDGTSDAGEIVLRDRDGFGLRLAINPVTARVNVAALEREGGTP